MLAQLHDDRSIMMTRMRIKAEGARCQVRYPMPGARFMRTTTMRKRKSRKMAYPRTGLELKLIFENSSSPVSCVGELC